jgi:hypothetical protein
MSDRDVCCLLKEAGDISAPELELAAVRVQEQDGFQDAEMALLVDDPDSRCLFLKCLHSVLIKNHNMNDTDESIIIRGDLLRWGMQVPGSLSRNDLATWLKFAIERYPFRLAIAIDRQEWKKGRNTPLDDGFWFNADAPNGTLKVAQPKTDNGLITWSTPDPRPWKKPSWMRFFGKRICWIDKADVNTFINSDDSKSFFEAYFPSFSFEPAPNKWEWLALWLRLKWLEHLAKRVRGLDRVEGVTAIRLEFISNENSTPYNPATVPILKIEKSSESCNKVATVNGIAPYLKREDSYCGATFCFKASCREGFLDGHYGFHRLARGLDGYGNWQVAEPLYYGAKLSGALPSATSFLELSGESKSLRAARFFLLLVEETLLRMVVVDERAQAWVSNDAETAGAAIQRGIFIAWLEKEREYNQPAFPEHNICAVLGRDWKDKVELNLTSPNQTDKLDKSLIAAMRGRKPLDGLWPIAGEVLLIHQGILDKAFDKDVAARVADLKDNIPFVAVISGRGKPDTVPYGVRFLPFSGVQACMVSKVVDKTLLVRQLMALGGET